jgi:hypothetical protein
LVCRSGGKCELAGSEYRVYPSSMSFEAAREKKLTLNMSRALGHNTLSRHGVLPVPDVTELKLSPHSGILSFSSFLCLCFAVLTDGFVCVFRVCDVLCVGRCVRCAQQRTSQCSVAAVLGLRHRQHLLFVFLRRRRCFPSFAWHCVESRLQTVSRRQFHRVAKVRPQLR